jgi:hypothetical protein
MKGMARFVAPAVAALAVGISAHAAGAATVALWHMEETSGSTMRDSVGSNDGALKNVALGKPGFRNNAYSFNGSSSIVTVPSSSALNPGSAAFSFTVHVKFSKVPPTDYDLLRKGRSSTSGGDYKLEILRRDSGTTGKASCHFDGSHASATKTAGPDLANGSWHTITCKKRASTITLVVDGVSYSKSVSVGSIANSAVLTVGAKSGGGDWYNGLMDEVSVSK